MLGHAEMVMRSLDPKKDSVVIANMGRALPTLAQFATDSDNVGELTREFEEALNQLDYRNFWDIRKNNHFTHNNKNYFGANFTITFNK